MLKALAEVSGRKLPMIIDTPLARLDSIHRDRLVENFYPTASHQVIILSTDTEIDISYKEKLTPYLAQSYLLNFNEKSETTEVSTGYFNRQSRDQHAI